MKRLIIMALVSAFFSLALAPAAFADEATGGNSFVDDDFAAAGETIAFSDETFSFVFSPGNSAGSSDFGSDAASGNSFGFSFDGISVAFTPDAEAIDFNGNSPVNFGF